MAAPVDPWWSDSTGLAPRPDGADARPPHPALVLPPDQLAGRIQHALVGQAITERQVRSHVVEAVEFRFDAAFVPPAWVGAARRQRAGSSGRLGSFVDYPHGSSSTAARAAEAAAMLEAGVDELDATINVGYLLSSRMAEFRADLAAVIAAAAPIGVKFMLELPLLTAVQRGQAVTAAVDAGAAFVTNASRGAVGIADPATISYLRAAVPPSVGVKAAGGIKTIEQVRSVLVAGADLVGTAAGISIVTGARLAGGSLYSY